jgi:hypothetical protein
MIPPPGLLHPVPARGSVSVFRLLTAALAPRPLSVRERPAGRNLWSKVIDARGNTALQYRQH